MGLTQVRRRASIPIFHFPLVFPILHIHLLFHFLYMSRGQCRFERLVEGTNCTITTEGRTAGWTKTNAHSHITRNLRPSILHVALVLFFFTNGSVWMNQNGVVAAAADVEATAFVATQWSAVLYRGIVGYSLLYLV